MRDFNVRDINGNVVINDNSTEHKLLINCSNEELLREDVHRRELLVDERKRKNRSILKLLFISALLCVAAFIWYQINDGLDMASISLGGAGVIIGFATIQQSQAQTEFEQRQISALNEIQMLLRERGFR